MTWFFVLKINSELFVIISHVFHIFLCESFVNLFGCYMEFVCFFCLVFSCEIDMYLMLCHIIRDDCCDVEDYEEHVFCGCVCVF